MARRHLSSDKASAGPGLARLWADAPKPRPGPYPKLRAREIARVAIELADRHDLEAVTMRGVADRLGVAVMNLYGYVPAKADLVDLMVDEALGGSPTSGPEGSLRARLEGIAAANWNLVLRHPWLLKVDDHRPVLGPGVLAKYERELAALDGLGLSDPEMQAALSALLALVRRAARAKLNALTAAERTGETDAEWWALRAPLLAAVTSPDTFPVAARVGSAVGEAVQSPDNPDVAFRFGLDRYLDGLVAYIDGKRGSSNEADGQRS